MPTYAILGATGSTGSSLLRYLHQRSGTVNINLYARSPAKVESMHPYVKTAKNIKSFIGDLSNADLLKECLRGVNVIFCAVAQNINEPGCSISQRVAHTIVAALEKLWEEDGPSFRCPLLVVLGSAALNPRFNAHVPRPVHWVLERGNYYVYDDLAKAIDYVKEHKWIPMITAEPPALVKDVSSGYELSTEKVSVLVSYDDLARGMVQMAEEGDGQKWVGQGVGIKSTGKVKKDVWPLINYQVTGLIAYFFPSLWKYGHGKGKGAGT
ncbi:stcq_emeni sterigmatocystin biosynthesis protein stcq [Lasallia pustulata]|uniref:Stcq_emeni sterigmatocystin biosynthesis protein stcq n=1 Tax=Lasallia pustulata TaxID=136370 RepID=A0A1W5D684_9LECA|nr:stcq_emeni sterigmatocystin biosynthesis protein stcq [Lasallia pustulata]